MHIVVRYSAAKAMITCLAIIIAVILIAPQVDLDPAVPRADWTVLLVLLLWQLGLIFLFGCRDTFAGKFLLARCLLFPFHGRGQSSHARHLLRC
jgi:hypothetical protein